MPSTKTKNATSRRPAIVEQERENLAAELIASAHLSEADEDIAPIALLGRDTIKAIKAGVVTDEEARYLANIFYTLQKDRIRMQLRLVSLRKAGKPFLLVEHYRDQLEILEKNAAKILCAWAKTKPVWKWIESIHGIGPILGSSLIAYTPPERCTSAGSLWRYAGVDVGPMSELASHSYSRIYKRLFWLCGESFVKQSHEKSFYRQMYDQRKQYEHERNERGEYAEQAAEMLRRFNFGRDTVAYQYYSKGMLPPGHIHARARRWATKLFFSHFAQVHYEMTFNQPQPTIYTIAVLGHKDYIPPPNYEPLNKNIQAPDHIIPMKATEDARLDEILFDDPLAELFDARA